MKRNLLISVFLFAALGLSVCVGGTTIFDRPDAQARDSGLDIPDSGLDIPDSGLDIPDSGVDERSACSATLGTWVPNTCGHYTCGVPSPLACASGGCDCGPGRTFRDGAGCATALPGECPSSCADACDTPPAPTCINDTTLRTYASAGTCEAGECTYAFTDSSCTRCPDQCSSAGAWTPLPEGGLAARAWHSAIWSGTEMIIWGGFGGTHRADGGRFNPATDTWSTVVFPDASSARFHHSAVWTGTEMITWGGYTENGTEWATVRQDGERFNPATNSWTTLDATGGPSARAEHTAIWTGTEMIVWGGFGERIGDSLRQVRSDGSRFNSATSTWTLVNMTGAPSARGGHSAIWTGTEMIVWGGSNGSSLLPDGARFNPATNTWTALATTGAPSARYNHSAIWTGTEMIIWGGYGSVFRADSALQDGGRFNPVTNTWSSLDVTDAPSARGGHSAIWTGTEMIIWGGDGDGASTVLRDGARWRP